MKLRKFVALQGMNKWNKTLFSGVQRALDNRFVVPLRSMIHRQGLYITFAFALLVCWKRVHTYRDIHEHTLVCMSTHEQVTISYPSMFMYIHVMLYS